MQHINAPWRSAYFEDRKSNCVFCDMANSDNDEDNMILFRDSKCFGVMNLYPYSPGHFMIIPYLHTDAVEDLDEQSWLQISLHVKSGIKLLKEHFGATGVNIGMNLGSASGAGIAKHIHYHLVPRRNGDTNFITTIGDCRVNGIDFKKIYLNIKNAVPKYFDFNHS